MTAQVSSRGREVGLIANDARGTFLQPHRAIRQDRLILDYLAIAQPDGSTSLRQALAWDKVRRLPRRAIVVITPSADPDWVHLLQAVRGRRTTLIVFYIDGSSFGGPDKNPTFDLGQDVDLYVVRKGDDFVIITELPGVKASDLDIKVTGNAIRIAGIKTVDYTEKASRHRRERMAGSFDRTITIPVEIDPERVKAELRDGVLALYLARAERDKPKSIKVV